MFLSGTVWALSRRLLNQRIHTAVYSSLPPSPSPSIFPSTYPTKTLPHQMREKEMKATTSGLLRQELWRVGAVGTEKSSHDGQNGTFCSTQGAFLPTLISSTPAQKSHDHSKSLYNAIVRLWASSNNHKKNFKYKWNKEWKKSGLHSPIWTSSTFIYLFTYLGEKCGSTKDQNLQPKGKPGSFWMVWIIESLIFFSYPKSLTWYLNKLDVFSIFFVNFVFLSSSHFSLS